MLESGIEQKQIQIPVYNQPAPKNKLSLACDNSREPETEPRR